jgi:hypothetical protein
MKYRVLGKSGLRVLPRDLRGKARQVSILVWIPPMGSNLRVIPSLKSAIVK